LVCAGCLCPPPSPSLNRGGLAGAGRCGLDSAPPLASAHRRAAAAAALASAACALTSSRARRVVCPAGLPALARRSQGDCTLLVPDKSYDYEQVRCACLRARTPKTRAHATDAGHAGKALTLNRVRACARVRRTSTLLRAPSASTSPFRTSRESALAFACACECCARDSCVRFSKPVPRWVRVRVPAPC